MSPIKVLLVDDSAVVRGILSKAIHAHDDLTVIATASNGLLGVQAAEKHLPDVVILDIEMPVMDGRQAVVELRQRFPRMPIIMFSTLTESGAADTIACMKAGASDFALKPSTNSGVVSSVDGVIQDVIEKIRALANVASVPARAPMSRPAPSPRADAPTRAPAPEPRTPRPVPRPTPKRAAVAAAPGRRPLNTTPELVVIGSSTGGPTALETLFTSIERPLPVPVMVVQHMPPMFTKALAERLDRKTATTVVEATDGEMLRPGQCYIAPGSLHMAVDRTPSGAAVKLYDGPPVNSCKPAVDPLFESAAELYGASALGVVLTGMGSDGAAGAGHLATAGAHVITQSESTCVVYGMPRAVDEAGHSTARLSVEEIAARLKQLTGPASARKAA